MNDIIPTCSQCKRERTVLDDYDYSPLQVLTGKPFGWYSGSDGEMCGKCFTELFEWANAPRGGES